MSFTLFYKERKTVAMTTYNDYVKWRRTFHQFPEVSQKEYETTKRLKRILQAFDIKIIDYPFRNRAYS